MSRYIEIQDRKIDVANILCVSKEHEPKSDTHFIQVICNDGPSYMIAFYNSSDRDAMYNDLLTIINIKGGKDERVRMG